MIADRSNPCLFRDTLIKLIEAPVLEYKAHGCLEMYFGMATRSDLTT